MLIDVMICFMKRNVLTIILSLVIFTALAGCSDESATGALKEAETAPAITEVEDLPDADITIPSGLVGSEITDIMNQSSADYSGKDNGDGTFTYIDWNQTWEGELKENKVRGRVEVRREKKVKDCVFYTPY